jgi:hypothetical protein
MTVRAAGSLGNMSRSWSWGIHHSPLDAQFPGLLVHFLELNVQGPPLDDRFSLWLSHLLVLDDQSSPLKIHGSSLNDQR